MHRIRTAAGVSCLDRCGIGSGSPVACTWWGSPPAVLLWAILLWAITLWIATAPAPALSQEITANYAADAGIIMAEIHRTHAAASAGNASEARLAMENTYRLWRVFRQRNIDSRPDEPAFAAALVRAEAHLFAATQQVDRQQWPAAAAELESARQVLREIPVTPR